MRNCYLLTGNNNSDRAQFSKNILEKVGFNVHFYNYIPHENKVLSNKISMMEIYKIIANGTDEWVYVFEDDIDLLEPITINDIIKYESISNNLFYLGACMYNTSNLKINIYPQISTPVAIVQGGVRGLHAIALSKSGAKELLEFSKNWEHYEYMDMILEEFTNINPANVIRYDLQSYIFGHRGIFFQNRKKFPSTI
jgi:hypothetical protein